MIRSLALAALSIVVIGAAQAQIPPEKQVEMLLGAARKAYGERNYPFAVEKFKEFLQKFGGHADAPQARYGLALTYLEMPERKFVEAQEQLQALAGNKAMVEHPFVMYYLGLIKRAQGVSELAQAQAKPNEAPQRRATAAQRFTEAQQQFAAAAVAFKERLKFDPAVKELTPEQEWLPRSLVDQSEMELRIGKTKEAQTSLSEFAKDGPMAKSRYVRVALYYHGYASFLLNEFPNAAKSLNRQEILNDAVFGSHARYLIGRVHQHDGEQAEATTQYQAVLDHYAKDKVAATETLKRPEQFKNLSEEKARLEQLVKFPPEHVVSAAFAAATLHYEAGRFGEALGRFQEFAKNNPDSPRTVEALLHVGFCQVQSKAYVEAIATLTPLAGRAPNLADQALLWLGKAQASNFDPNNAQAKTAALTAAINTLRQAIERAGQMAAADPGARVRRAEIQLELADTQQLAGQHREAAAVYEQLINEKMLTHRIEELTQRFAAAWHLAGDYARSDQICAQFFTSFPQSPLRPAVAFRQAENAYFMALNAIKNPNLARLDRDKVFDEAGKRYQAVVDKYPESERIGLARYGLALCHIQKADFEKAQAVLEAIPPPERAGDLAIVPYQLASCLIKLAPVKTDDAIAAGRLQEQLQNAATLLDAFAGANPQAPEATDALLKLGHCQQRLFALLAQPPEKQAAIAAARAAYQKIIDQYAKDPRVPQAIMERAKCQAMAGDRGGAMNELRRFATAPLQDTPIAPMALLRLASFFREQNQAPEAVKVLDEARKKHEGPLAADKDRAAWVHLLRYHHGVALLESNKPAEARALFDQVVQAPDKAIAAEAALRGGQCRLVEGRAKIDAARQKLAAAGPKPEDKANAERGVNEAFAAVAQAGQYLEGQAEAFKAALPTAEARARMLYDAAWAYRVVAEFEVNATTTRLQNEEQQRLLKEAAAKNPMKPPVIPLPEIARGKVPVQPSEAKARDSYKRLIEQFSDLSLAGDSRLELAELFAERDENEPAIKLLREALDKEPAQELTDRVRLRLGTCLVAMKDAKGALAHFDSIADPRSPLLPQAMYRAGEALIELNQVPEAIKRFSVFRDKGEFQNLPGLTDRALLRLGHALAKTEQWELSRVACEQVAARFGNGPWANDARYGCGWARQKMKQFDDAVNWYTQVANNTTTELGAKAQLQIGLCRLEQKRFAEAASALLVVPYTFDYPELNAAALCEAARCFVELKQPAQAEKLLQRVLKDHPTSEWSKAAKERLDALKK